MFTVGQVLCSPGSAWPCQLPAALGSGSLVVTAEEDLGPEAAVSFRLQASLPYQRMPPVLLILQDDASPGLLTLASGEVRS